MCVVFPLVTGSRFLIPIIPLAQVEEVSRVDQMLLNSNSADEPCGRKRSISSCNLKTIIMHIYKEAELK